MAKECQRCIRHRGREVQQMVSQKYSKNKKVFDVQLLVLRCGLSVRMKKTALLLVVWFFFFLIVIGIGFYQTFVLQLLKLCLQLSCLALQSVEERLPPPDSTAAHGHLSSIPMQTPPSWSSCHQAPPSFPLPVTILHQPPAHSLSFPKKVWHLPLVFLLYPKLICILRGFSFHADIRTISCLKDPGPLLMAPVMLLCLLLQQTTDDDHILWHIPRLRTAQSQILFNLRLQSLPPNTLWPYSQCFGSSTSFPWLSHFLHFLIHIPYPVQVPQGTA